MLSIKLLRPLAMALLPFVFLQEAHALDYQLLEDRKNIQRSQAEYFNTNKDQRFEVKVNMVGGVQMPGVYHLPDNTNLLEAIALAGGTVNNADLTNVYIKRPTTNGNFETYHYDLSKMVADKEVHLPPIGDHDTVLVETSNSSQNWVLALSILSAALGVLATGYVFYEATKH
jgi:DNA uptake protein ComE-like DNA-binding protein